MHDSIEGDRDDQLISVNPNFTEFKTKRKSCYTDYLQPLNEIDRLLSFRVIIQPTSHLSAILGGGGIAQGMSVKMHHVFSRGEIPA